MNISLVLAGGTGSRLGADTPKQYLRVHEKMIITYCLDTFFNSDIIDMVWIVADEGWRADIEEELKVFSNDASKLKGFSKPGANRQLSIYNGFKDIGEYIHQHEAYVKPEDISVMIHDAARPCITHELIESCFNALVGHDGVMPVLPMKDTVYLSDDGRQVSKLLDRNKIYAGQAPEVFRFVPYFKACETLIPDKIMQINGSTEPAIAAGLDIVMVPGDENNFKITTRQDLSRFENSFILR